MNLQINKIDENIFKKHDVKLAYLFGSQAKGNAMPESDFDIAVLFEEGNRLDFFDKAAYLKEDLRNYFPNEVNVVALNGASSLLKYEAIANGQLLYTDDEISRIDAEVLFVKEYIDDRYVRDIYYKALDRRVEGGLF